jgi:hypothetical protein
VWEYLTVAVFLTAQKYSLSLKFTARRNLSTSLNVAFSTDAGQWRDDPPTLNSRRVQELVAPLISASPSFLGWSGEGEGEGEAQGARSAQRGWIQRC